MGDNERKRVSSLLEETLRLSRDEREGYLRRACGEDAALLAEVTVRLEVAEATTQRLDDQPEPSSPRPLDIELGAGDRLGPYDLIGVLGEGGMGRVFLADQGAPVQRRVAIKLIKLGMDTREVLSRFESERNALAMLNHPNVAAALDAGHTDSGRPYFVMEYVDGLPISEYCDNHRMTVRERLVLFIQALEGIQHAHQKGIIHRDLKPNNILVTHRQHKPLAKIIDFGIAKSTEQKLVEDTFHTRLGVVIGTPIYMSPEQAGRNPLDVDTRADVYAMGVLLYELLCGAQPFDPKVLAELSLSALQQVIREEDPPRPSDRLWQLPSEVQASIARLRQTEVRHLRRRLRGDLDWIVMKALAKERRQRYASAAAMAEDIRRYLDFEPVEAGPPSRWYRLGKFMGRHRILMVSGLAVAMTLIGGLAVTGWALLEANRAHQQAEQQAAVIRATNALLYQLFVPETREDAARTRGRSLDESIDGLLDRLDDGSAFAGEAFATMDSGRTLAEVELAVRTLVAERDALLGRDDRAMDQFQRAVDLAAAVHGTESPAWFEARVGLADLLSRSDAEAAVTLYNQIINRGTVLLGAEAAPVIVAELGLARIRADQGRVQQAHDQLLQTLQRGRGAGVLRPALEARLQTGLAELAGRLGRLDEAMKAATRALTLERRRPGGGAAVAAAHERLADLALRRGLMGVAVEHLRGALEGYRQWAGERAPSTVALRIRLAGLLSHQGDVETARLELFDQLAGLKLSPEAAALAGVIDTLLALSEVEVVAGDAASADRFAAEAVRAARDDSATVERLFKALWTRSQSALAKGDGGVALEAVEEARVLAPEGWGPSLDLQQVRALAVAGDDRGALEALERVTGTGPERFKVNAWVDLAAGRANAALESLSWLEASTETVVWQSLAEWLRQRDSDRWKTAFDALEAWRDESVDPGDIDLPWRQARLRWMLDQSLKMAGDDATEATPQ